MVRHLIVFNAAAPEPAVRAMAARAKEVLGAIPGVTDVYFGVAVAATARYRYYFDIGFADASVIDRLSRAPRARPLRRRGVPDAGTRPHHDRLHGGITP